MLTLEIKEIMEKSVGKCLVIL